MLLVLHTMIRMLGLHHMREIGHRLFLLALLYELRVLKESVLVYMEFGVRALISTTLQILAYLILWLHFCLLR